MAGNIPDVKLGMIAVSRDCFVISISENRRKAIGEECKKLGIEVRLLGEEKQAFLDRQKSGDFELQYSLSWGTPYDPQSYVSSCLMSIGSEEKSLVLWS